MLACRLTSIAENRRAIHQVPQLCARVQESSGANILRQSNRQRMRQLKHLLGHVLNVTIR